MHATRTRLAASLALLAFCLPSFARDTLEERIARVENGLRPAIAIKGRAANTSKLADRMAALKVPGVSVAVINGGTIEWARGYGLAEAGTTRMVTPDTLFQAASISKPVAAIGALRLVEQGKLSLDEDVNVKLQTWKLPPGAQSADNAVTLRKLLNHSAGTTVHGFRGYARGEPVPTLIEVLNGTKPANSAAVRVDTRPGETWRYSGGGLSIVQLLMSTASGKDFAPLMKDSVLDPLAMKHSTFQQPLPPALHAQAATGHDQQGAPIKGKWHTYPEQAAAGLWSTPSDLARYAIELQNASAGRSNKVISAAMAKQMLTRLKGDYGLGIAVGGAMNVPTFSHAGSNEGFKAMLFAYTSTGQGAVIMTNGDLGGALVPEILRSLSAEYGWSDYRVNERVLASVDSKLYAAYAGNYRVGGVPITVTREGQRLFIQAPPLGAERVELFPASNTSFFALIEQAEFRFEKDAAGAQELVIKAGNTIRAKRVP